MSNVVLTIGGRNFTVACADGEEDHIAALGRMIDGKLSAMGQAHHNEARMLLFAALLLADELHEARSSTGAPAAASSAPAIPPARLDAIADRLEYLAASLEG